MITTRRQEETGDEEKKKRPRNGPATFSSSVRRAQILIANLKKKIEIDKSLQICLKQMRRSRNTDLLRNDQKQLILFTIYDSFDPKPQLVDRRKII